MFKNIFGKLSKPKPISEDISRHYLFALFNEIGAFPKSDVYNYEAALTHGSYNHSMRAVNERLEFLGDAVISLSIAQLLYQKYTKKDEGFLTKARSKLVSRDHLNAVAHNLNITKYIHHTLDEQQIALMPNLAGNSFEALMGAFFLDYGYEKTSEIIVQILDNYADIEDQVFQDNDHKSALYQWMQARNRPLHFKTEKINDNGKVAMFESIVFSQKDEMGRGIGKNKKVAEQEAAKHALENLKV
jgi:ribonuclease-3